jgi:SAM-dependent methyltransferase
MPPRVAGDVDYEAGGPGYARQRRTDPRIAARVHAALGGAETIVNVGAGAGSYEPAGRAVTAVEPSAQMRRQRPARLPPAVDAVAEDLPFPDDAFDAAMATVTVHQWPDLERGLAEMRRVSRGPVVVLTAEPAALELFWLAEYAPELLASERRRFPAIDRIARALGGAVSVTPVPVPVDCADGFIEAYYARPEEFLDPAVRRSQSAWGFISESAAASALRRLGDDLASGEWDRRFGALRTQAEYDGALRLITALPG